MQSGAYALGHNSVAPFRKDADEAVSEAVKDVEKAKIEYAKVARAVAAVAKASAMNGEPDASLAGTAQTLSR